jgi:hypothetical protein
MGIEAGVEEFGGLEARALVLLSYVDASKEVLPNAYEHVIGTSLAKRMFTCLGLCTATIILPMRCQVEMICFGSTFVMPECRLIILS